MTTTNDLWELLGDTERDDIPHVLTKLFAIYEEKLQLHPEDPTAIDFFKHLSQALSQVDECNLNRR
jgi:mannose-6-phosphate isomerase class I